MSSILSTKLHLPPDFPPVHSCQCCENVILDPGARDLSLSSSKITRREWAAFNPRLTVGEMVEARKHGCSFGKSLLSAYSEGIDVNTPVWYSFEPLYDGKPGFQSITFGIPERRDQYDRSEFEQDDIRVYRSWTHDLIAISGKD